MNKNIKNKWLKALRSGEYKQGKSALRDGDTYCCLGVLTELYRKETGLGIWEKGKIGMDFYNEEEISMGVPSKTICEWAGLNDENPSVESEHGICIAEINDKGVSFNEIADIIEEQL